jgi:hypothetical protein
VLRTEEIDHDDGHEEPESTINKDGDDKPESIHHREPVTPVQRELGAPERDQTISINERSQRSKLQEIVNNQRRSTTT